MQIRVEDACMARLMAVANLTAPEEFSGLAFSRNVGDEIVVYDFVPMDYGSRTFTEIPTKKLLALMERPDYANLKGWIHRHPMGSGVPGFSNWSGTDENTIQNTPLGGLPDMVGWSWSMVLTPHGWVGRVDNYRSHKTVHVEVLPSFKDVYETVEEIIHTKKAVQYNPAPFAPENVMEEEAWEFCMGLTAEELLDYGMSREEVYQSIMEGVEEIEDDFPPYIWVSKEERQIGSR